MYKNNSEFFAGANEKLSLMVSPTNKSVVSFPNQADSQIEADIESTKALALATVLRAGFNLGIDEEESIKLSENKDGSISIIFGDEVIQKIIIEDAKNSKDIQKVVDKTLTKEKANKVTYIFIDKETFLQNRNGLQTYIGQLQNLDRNQQHLAGNLRNELIGKSGIYIEEYEDKKALTDDKLLDMEGISHYNTFSNPIVYKVNNYNAISDNLNKIKKIGYCGDKTPIKTPLRYGIHTPLESFNAIFNVSNSRELDLEDIKNNKIDKFLETLVKNAMTYKELNEVRKEVKEEKALEKIDEIIKTSLAVSGNAKQLFSLAPSDGNYVDPKQEIFLHEYSNENGKYICINSKGTCLGNGQHSTSTFKILDLILGYDKKSEMLMIEKLNCSRNNMRKVFKKTGSNPYEELKEEIKEKINTLSGGKIEFEEFVNYFKKLEMQIDWSIYSNEKTLRNEIINDNAQREQDKSDEWINEQKEYVNSWLAKYKDLNKDVISKYSNSKDHKYANLGINLDLIGIKTVDSSPSIANNTNPLTSINDIYPYLMFIATKSKNKSTYEEPNYTEVSSKKTTNSRDNLRNVYQTDTVTDEWASFFSDVFNRYFKRPELNSAFNSFLEMSLEATPVELKKLQKEIANEEVGKKNSAFLKLGFLNQMDKEAILKAPAVIIYNELAKQYYSEFIANDITYKGNISEENFTRICFFAYASKIGREAFTTECVEVIGETIIKDVCNAFHKYYKESNGEIFKTDALKRKRTNIKAGTTEHNDLLSFMSDLFEPYVNNVNKEHLKSDTFDKNNLKHLKNTKNKGTWIDEMLNKENIIKEEFLKNFEEDSLKKTKKKQP